MRIGVDIRPLTGPIYGIGRYTFCLLDELFAYPDINWYLYADRPVVHFVDKPVDSDNVVIRQYQSSNRIFSLYRSQVQFSRWAKSDELDIFWSPRHHLPLLLDPGIRKVVTIHDMVWARFPETMMFANRMLDRVLMPRSIAIADQVIAVSTATRNDIRETCPYADNKTRVIHEAVVRFADTMPNNRHHPYFLFVGTLEPRKNLNRLVAAFEQYRLAGGDHELLIVGASGWKQKNIVSETARDVIHTLGYVSDDELASLYRHAQALVLPSLYEGFGLPALEAMQYGTPVIGSNNSAIPEVVGDGGLLVEASSSDEMCQAMLEISSDRDLRAELGQKAELESRKYSWKQAAVETMAVFTQLAGGL